MTAVVLAVNPGSASLKVVLRDPEPSLTVDIDRLGTADASWITDGVSTPYSADLPAALRLLADLLTSKGIRPDAVAHRVVHGGPVFDRATVVTDLVRKELAELTAWAPLHLPGELASIDTARAAWPDAVHIACFDTAFHHTLPDEARRLPLPASADALGLRRYGFHGLSVQSIVDAVPDLGDAVVAHLGNGCSVTAVSGGRSMHNSMSVTPTSGVMSGTRAGDLDPEIPLLLLAQSGATPDTVRTLLDRQSGLAGIAGGRHDVRDLLAARDHDPAADLALRVFTRGVAMAVAAAATALTRWDTLVFTGGIGEHSPVVRNEICRRLAAVWTTSDPRVLTVPADEAAVMDRESRLLLAASDPPEGAPRQPGVASEDPPGLGS
jgi:acetate kinase